MDLQIHMFANLVVLVITLTSSLAATVPLNFTIAKPNCSDRCGNISIPFPFGTSKECCLADDFFINCTRSSKAFLTNTQIEITSISLDGQITVLQSIAYQCLNDLPSCTCESPPKKIGGQYSTQPTRSFQILCTCIDKKGQSWINLESFTVNNTANKFTVVGCDTTGFVSGKLRGDQNYLTGCSSTCDSKYDLQNGTCNGLGCCQTSFPKNVRRVDLQLTSNNDYKFVHDFNDCGFAFVAEASALNFSMDNLTSLRNVSSLPMVIDWGIGNGTCKQAYNTPTYVCKSVNSTCYDPENGDGYRCACMDGYQGNPYLVNGCQDVDECQDPALHHCEQNRCKNTLGSYKCFCPEGYHGDGRRGGRGCDRDDQSLVYRLVAGVLLGIIVLLLSSCWLYVNLQRRRLIKMRQHYFRQNGGLLLQEKLKGREGLADAPSIFDESVLKKATNNFHDSLIIGKGGFGIVYKGFLPDNTIVAIKKAREVRKEVDQFINEVTVLSQINHRNVVKLLGCCLETRVPLLVYEFISNGTLFEHIHDKAKTHFLSWEKRLRIAAETAGVLSYLHSAASTPIIHRDIKSSNILLDSNFTAKVSDFGASKLFPLDKTKLTTLVQGTFGYLDPEYFQTSRLTEKSDVYSFGVVLVELLTGRKAVRDDVPEEEINLANFFLSVVKEEHLLFQILDDNVAREGEKELVMKVAHLAKRCLNGKGDERPCMKEVERELEGLRVGVKHATIFLEDSALDEESVVENDEFSSFTAWGDSSRSTGFHSSIDHHSGKRLAFSVLPRLLIELADAYSPDTDVIASSSGKEVHNP
ncbi:hypothetical protein ACS0TY_036148 [Phlomoides rotata]